MQLDDALTVLGAYGRFQIFVYLSISMFDNLPSIWHMSVMTFLGLEPEHHCKVPEGADNNLTIPKNGKDNTTVDKCNMYPHYGNGTYGNETVPCTEGWYYDPDPVTSSVVTEWDLVCKKNVMPETSQMVFNFGVMFGAIVFGFLSDKFGRKKAFISALLFQSVIGSLVAASPNIYVFMALRFFVGALEQGVNITGFIMATELFPPKQRSIMAVTHEFFWAGGGAILPIFAYFLRDWRPLQLCVSLPSILGIGLIWMIPESLVWLVCKGRYEEAEAILQKAAKFNGKHLPPNCLSDQDTCKPIMTPDGGPPPSERSVMSVSQKKTYTLIDLFRTPMLRRITICTCCLWALNTMVYYGLSYNTPNLPGSLYLNFFIGQLVEIPSVAATLWLIYRFGRRWPLCLSHVFGGAVCIASPFIPEKTESGHSLEWLAITLAMLGKFSINMSFTIIYIYGPEIYPTVLRNTGTGIGSMCGRIGGILYPYINYLSKLDHPYSKKLPLVVFGVLSVVGGFMALPLPETQHNPLPETVEDVENYKEFCRAHKQQEEEKEKENGGLELNHIVDRKSSTNGSTPTAPAAV